MPKKVIIIDTPPHHELIFAYQNCFQASVLFQARSTFCSGRAKSTSKEEM